MRDRAGLALLFSACAACASPVSVPEARLYTLRDLAGSAYASSFVRRGDPLRLLSPPFSDVPAAQDPALDGLTVFPAFSEGGPAAYLTTEVWEEFPKVWVQPLYSHVVVRYLGSATSPRAGPWCCLSSRFSPST